MKKGLILPTMLVVLVSCTGERASLMAPKTDPNGLYRVYARASLNTCENSEADMTTGYIARVQVGETGCSMFGSGGTWDPATRTGVIDTGNMKFTIQFVATTVFVGTCSENIPAADCQIDWAIYGLKVSN